VVVNTSLGWLVAEIHPLATLNAALNGAATLLLLAGFGLIKSRRETAHKWAMLSAFFVSIAFLVSYLAYHVWPVGQQATPFAGTGNVRTVYYAILISHVVLAMTVPVLAVLTIVHGLRDNRPRHVRLARWTFPIWLYVSVTGVVIYWMLYHLYPPAAAKATIDVLGGVFPGNWT
jgi:putative membrane protein